MLRAGHNLPERIESANMVGNISPASNPSTVIRNRLSLDAWFRRDLSFCSVSKKVSLDEPQGLIDQMAFRWLHQLYDDSRKSCPNGDVWSC